MQAHIIHISHIIIINRHLHTCRNIEMIIINREQHTAAYFTCASVQGGLWSLCQSIIIIIIMSTQLYHNALDENMAYFMQTDIPACLVSILLNGTQL